MSTKFKKIALAFSFHVLLIVLCFAEPKKSLANEIYNSLDPMGWALLICGWLVYWLMKLNSERKNRGDLFSCKKFFSYNVFEILISIATCVTLAIISESVSKDIIDLHGKVSIWYAGYSSSSILNGIISSRRGERPQIKTDNYPTQNIDK